MWICRGFTEVTAKCSTGRTVFGHKKSLNEVIIEKMTRSYHESLNVFVCLSVYLFPDLFFLAIKN